MSKDWRLGLIAGVALAVAVVGALFATGICSIESASPTPTVPAAAPTMAATPFRAATATAVPTATPRPTATPAPVMPMKAGDAGLKEP